MGDEDAGSIPATSTIQLNRVSLTSQDMAEDVENSRKRQPEALHIYPLDLYVSPRPSKLDGDAPRSRVRFSQVARQ